MPKISLDKAISGKPAKAEARELIYLEGDLGPDHDENRFRLYPDAVNRSRYYLIRREDVERDTYRWNQQELAAAGFSGQTRYRVAVKAIATVQWITVRSGRLSSLLADSIAPYVPAGSVLSAAISGEGPSTQMGVQDMPPKQQRMLQMMSNILKSHHDTAMAIIRNMK